MPNPAIGKFIGIGLALTALTATDAQAQNFQRGQALFEHQCHGCHGDLTLAKAEGSVKSKAELKQKITSWAKHTGTDWGNSEIKDVLFYMDKSFYHLTGNEKSPGHAGKPVSK
jgi:mono/diheme cytochrome c family protein